MALLRILVVDDEPLARNRLRELLAAHDDVELVGECRNGRSAVEAIQTLVPDIVLLDVEMPELDGIGVLEALAPEALPVVVFVTAYDRYALRAFELHALDYLLKPFDDERFEQALARARTRVHQGHAEGMSRRLVSLLRDLTTQPSDPQALGEPSGDGPMDRLAIRSARGWHVVRVEDIDWIEGAGVYARLVVGDRAHLLRASLNDLEQRLPDRLIRIHRSTIVNLDRIAEVRPHTHGEYLLLLEDGTTLKASRSYSDRIRAFLERLGG